MTRHIGHINELETDWLYQVRRQPALLKLTDLGHIMLGSPFNSNRVSETVGKRVAE
jgi:hypothetical protein